MDGKKSRDGNRKNVISIDMKRTSENYFRQNIYERGHNSLVVIL